MFSDRLRYDRTSEASFCNFFGFENLYYYYFFNFIPHCCRWLWGWYLWVHQNHAGRSIDAALLPLLNFEVRREMLQKKNESRIKGWNRYSMRRDWKINLREKRENINFLHLYEALLRLICIAIILNAFYAHLLPLKEHDNIRSCSVPFFQFSFLFLYFNFIQLKPWHTHLVWLISGWSDFQQVLLRLICNASSCYCSKSQ